MAFDGLGPSLAHGVIGGRGAAFIRFTTPGRRPFDIP